MNNNSIIFLDCDGVLNRFPHHPGDRMSWPPSDLNVEVTAESLGWLPEPTSIIRDLVNISGCKIVLSSTWRFHMSGGQVDEGLDVPRGSTIGATKDLLDGRGAEIIRWRKDNDHTGPFVIIDDSVHDIECFPELLGHIVRTKTEVGLIMGHIPLIKKCLEAPSDPNWRPENGNQESLVD